MPRQRHVERDHDIEPPKNVYAHIAGIDLIRTGERDFFVLEDNVRTPSGVSYVLENREIMMRLFPDAFAGESVSPVGNYPERLLENLRAVAPGGADDPVVVLLTPGRYNSAYFEHVFLAEQMGIELVEGGDLFVRDGYIWMRTTEGPVKVDVIYRRVDDAFMDPLAFRPDSLLAVPGLLSVVRSGRVALANALGDKAMYIYVPRMIEFYLGEHAILNNVHTYMLRDPKQRLDVRQRRQGLRADSSGHHAARLLLLASRGIFVRWEVGAPVAVARAFDHAELGPLMRATRPTVMTMLPATLLHLVREPGTTADDFSSLRLVRSGGDKVPAGCRRSSMR
jgi:uncharacterized circularly permuted ATP-grasp superfamily protein